MKDTVNGWINDISINPFHHSGSASIVKMKGEFDGYYRLSGHVEGNKISIIYAVNLQAREVGISDVDDRGDIGYE